MIPCRVQNAQKTLAMQDDNDRDSEPRGSSMRAGLRICSILASPHIQIDPAFLSSLPSFPPPT